ncbi:MAG TPA: TetR/AcrR family transcriptional regulator [Hyphomicrobiales bacterium]|nr:TetR/AcrR family transcriptional regulator [Hyphomicrobiales bacterium]
MEQFWREGFEASSIQKLLDATGINRGTLYNSFGDKDAFFRSCVERYNDQLKGIVDATLGNKELKADKALANFVDATVVALPPRQRTLGCLLVNSVCESIVWNPEIQKLLRDSLNTLRKAVLVRTRELEKSRALAKGLNAEKAADLVMALYTSAKVAARSGRAPKQLAELIGFTLGSLLK